MEDDNLWRECRRWLVELGVIHADNPINSDGSTLQEFARMFRSGVLLCKVIYFLDSSLIDIDRICSNANNSKILYYNNIELFLESCSNQLHIPKSKCFYLDDLFYMENFGNVLSLLSYMSHMEISKSKGIRPFPLEDSFIDQGIYSDVLLSDVLYEEEEDFTPYDCPFTWNQTNEYGTALESKPKIESRVPIDNETFEDYDPKLLELMQSEEKYIEDLQSMRKELKRKLIPVLGTHNCEAIFYRIQDLEKVNNSFYTILFESYPCNPEKIVDAFSTFKRMSLPYADYCSKYKRNIELLRKLQAKNSDVQQAVQEIDRNLIDGTLRDCLCKPFQRILCYSKILDNFCRTCKFTSTQNEDSMKEALNISLDLSKMAGVVISDEDFKAHFQKNTISNFSYLPEDIKALKNCGRFKLEADVELYAEHRSSPEDGCLYIFEETILILVYRRTYAQNRFLAQLPFLSFFVNVNRKNLRYRKTLLCSNLIFQETPVTTQSHEKAITLFDTNRNQTVAFAPKNLNTKNDIMHVLGNIMEIQVLKKTSKHRLVMTTFDITNGDSLLCDICHQILRGSYCQGYKCEHCGYLSHSSSICIRGFNEYKCFFQPMRSIDEKALNSPWWYGKMSRDEAFRFLYNLPVGSFVIRWSENEACPVITLRDTQVPKHLLIRWDVNGFHLEKLEADINFRTLTEFVEFYRENNLNVSVKTINTTLSRNPLPLWK